MKFSTIAATAVLVGSAAASPVYTSSKWKRNLQGLDFELINLARNLESLELAYWNQGLQNFTDADFTNAGYDGFRYYISLFRDQEIAHFTALNEAAGGGFKNCTYNTFPVMSPYDLIAVAQVVTSVGEGAFIGALGNLTEGALRISGGSILGNEARQNSKLREEIGQTYFNAPNFDTPLSASQAYSLAKPFLSGCPSSNPPINFKAIPPIVANFTGPAPHKAGAEISVMWDASAFYLGEDVHIQFLADVNSIAMPLKQASANAGMGTTTLPSAITQGTAFIVATNFEGEGPIPDAQNFGIGYVVVA